MRIIFQSFIFILLCSCSMTPFNSQKINGVSFVASRDTIQEKHVNPIVQINANYAAIMPFGFIKNLTHPVIIHNTNRQWYGETKAGSKQYINELRKKNIKIMIKPHIWVRRGEFTGHIKMENEADWKLFEDSYSQFLLEYAALAEETQAEILCIGTELEQFVNNRPEYWNYLIVEIRKVYKGKLTYAANWDEFKRTPFWSAIDYIGIDAYFPVSDSKTPTVLECVEGWKPHVNIIKALSEKEKKPILFTEFGYRSVDYSGREPWKSDRSMTEVNLEAQTNTTQALFEIFWKEDWFAGGFIWKWFHNYDDVGGEANHQFTPQNKPVETVIRDFYKR